MDDAVAAAFEDPMAAIRLVRPSIDMEALSVADDFDDSGLEWIFGSENVSFSEFCRIWGVEKGDVDLAIGEGA